MIAILFLAALFACWKIGTSGMGTGAKLLSEFGVMVLFFFVKFAATGA